MRDHRMEGSCFNRQLQVVSTSGIFCMNHPYVVVLLGPTAGKAQTPVLGRPRLPLLSHPGAFMGH